jgi:hypothetical protein
MERKQREKIPPALIQAIKSGNCVAFVGAGFSAPAQLPGWSDLLKRIVAKSVTIGLLQDQEKIKFFNETIDEASVTKNSDLFDLVGQLLEDDIGTKLMENFVEEELTLPSVIPKAMQKRLDMLNSIPFKAILTTNFDLLIKGPTPWSKATPRDAKEDPEQSSKRIKRERSNSGSNYTITSTTTSESEFPYAEVLRGLAQSDKYSIDSLIKSHLENENDSVSEDEADEYTYKPVIKLHGSLGTEGLERSLVWTRVGYRKLIHQTPGYANFIRSVLSTTTVLYLGFSFSDGYLNELRGEVLSMLYGDIVHSHRAHVDPIAYAIVPDKKAFEIDFFRRHEGVQIITWNTEPVPDQPKDFSGLDDYLGRIHDLTSFAFYIGQMLDSKKVLLIDRESTNLEQLSYLMRRSVTIYRRDRSVLLESGKEDQSPNSKPPASFSESLIQSSRSPEDGLSKIKDRLERGLKAFDLVIVTFGEDKSSPTEGKHLWKLFSDGMRMLPTQCQSPFIVYTTGWNFEERKRYCLSHGAFDVCPSIHSMVDSLSRIFDPALAPSVPTAESGPMCYSYTEPYIV